MQLENFHAKNKSTIYYINCEITIMIYNVYKIIKQKSFGLELEPSESFLARNASETHTISSSNGL